MCPLLPRSSQTRTTSFFCPPGMSPKENNTGQSRKMANQPPKLVFDYLDQNETSALNADAEDEDQAIQFNRMLTQVNLEAI